MKHEKTLRYFSTFSGIGGFELGVERAHSRLVGKQGETPSLSERREAQLSAGTDSKQASKQGNIGTEHGTQTSCIGYSEIDKYATQIYQRHYPDHRNYGDITKIDAESLPDFDLYVGGFPCQAFSIAGKRGGFNDTRGTLFFDVARILKAKQPRNFLLENVKGLLSHDNGSTFQTIVSTLVELGYGVEWQVLNSKDFGVPQNRERVFIVGHLGGEPARAVFPIGDYQPETPELSGQHSNTLTTRYYGGQANGTYIIEGKLNAQIGTLRTHKDGKGFRKVKSGLAPTIPARSREDGSGQPVVIFDDYNGNVRKDGLTGTLTTNTGSQAPRNGQKVILPSVVRRLTPTECERLQGFPDGWTEGVSDSQRYKTLGNAVTVNVIEAVIKAMYFS